MATIKAWHICISGFRQRTGEPSGMHKLWTALGVLRAPRTCVVLREWNADWEELADLIDLSSDLHRAPRVFVYAYSWGAGYGFPRLARYLGDRGIDVQVGVMAEPVYRSRLLCGRWLAFMPWPRIRVPKNVLHVHSLYQREDYPRGHRLVAESADVLPRSPADTVIHLPHLIERTHAFVDESPKFHSLCLSVAGVRCRATGYQRGERFRTET